MRFVPLLFLLLMAGHGQAEEPISFMDDVLPVLSKAGCSGSACHSKPAGQNGFKLSVFAYDPLSDFKAIVHDRRGRRLSPGAPEQSLLLLKATQSIPHEGGRRFAVGSDAYETVAQWIREGTPYAHEDDAPLAKISLDPPVVEAQGGDVIEFTVTAHYENGREREVTALAEFESNKEEMVEIDEHGKATVQERYGEAIVVARFLGEVVNARITVAKPTPTGALASLPRANFIDEHAYTRLEKLGLLPSSPCSDSDFIRRVSIDLIGQLPTPEATRTFLASEEPDKRAQWVEQCLQDPGFGDHWAVKWADLLRPNPARAGVKSVYLLDQWLRKVFRENWSMDRFAREVLTAQGSTHRHGPTVVYRDRRTPEDLTSLVSQVFLGVRLECARCHHHPNEKWSQEDYYQMAAFFGQMKRKGKGVSPPISGGWEVFYHGGSGSVKHPVTQAVMTPRAPDGPEVELVKEQDPRVALADWLVAPENPFFAQAMVNRVWGELFGRGIVHPVDDFRATNPPSNPDLLEVLAQDFVSHGYDLKHLLRRVVLSNLYQQSSEPNTSNLHDTENFSRSYRRRLAAEVVTDGLAEITEVSNVFEGLPEDSPANHVWNFKIVSATLDTFGQPDSSSDCPCERNLSTSVVQALHLMNAESLQAKLAHKEGRVKQLVASELTEEKIIEELYLATYSRFPSAEERQAALAFYKDPETDRGTASEDLLWALLNSAEFVFNH